MAGIDYREVGLKVGLEWHQRLATRHKLFCMCPPEMRSEKPDITIERRLYATQSELGEVDRAAAFEQERHRLFIYDM